MLSDDSIIEREYSALEAINDNFEKVVVSLDEIALPLRGGIKHIQAWNLQEIL
jgi:predicted AAA+ superfamily ATPase